MHPHPEPYLTIVVPDRSLVVILDAAPGTVGDLHASSCSHGVIGVGMDSARWGVAMHDLIAVLAESARDRGITVPPMAITMVLNDGSPGRDHAVPPRSSVKNRYRGGPLAALTCLGVAIGLTESECWDLIESAALGSMDPAHDPMGVA